MAFIQQISLKQRVMKAGLWSGAGFGMSLGLRFFGNLLMTRLLVPDMFGVMAVASTVIVGLAMFSDVGLKQNVVQSKRGHDASFLNTAWIFQILRGALLSVGAILICIFLAALGHFRLIPSDSAYGAPVLPYVLAALSISTCIAGFESTKTLEASRYIALGRITGMEFLSQFAGLTCMIGWVLLDRSIWALVAGTICSSMVRTIVSHFWLPGTRNTWHWDKSAADELLHFGKWILLSSVFGFLVNSGDRLLLGGLVNSTTLGLYAIALLFLSSVDGALSKLMTDVAFPAFSEVVRAKPSNLQTSYYKFTTIIASFSYFVAGFLMTFGETLIRLLYDQRYQGAGWMLQFLAPILLSVPFRLATQSFLAMGKPMLQSHVIMVRLLSLFIAVPICFNLWDFKGALLGIVFSHFAYLPIIIYYNWKHHLLNIRTELYLLAAIPAGLVFGQICVQLANKWI